MKRLTILDEYMGEVVSYGGFPMRRGDVIKDLTDVAKSVRPNNWLSIRDAGLIGLDQFNKTHPLPPGIEPISLERFNEIVRA